MKFFIPIVFLREMPLNLKLSKLSVEIFLNFSRPLQKKFETLSNVNKKFVLKTIFEGRK